jgi:hypothetical protein
MKIIRANISGFLGIDKADIRLGRVNIFFGPNGVGKSSVLEGILLPIFGETARQSRKKDWSHMIRYPAKKAELFVQVTEQADGSTIQHDLDGTINPKSNSMRQLKVPDLFDRVLLNPLAFFELPAKVKADLAGDVKLDPNSVRAELKARGTDDSLLNEVVSIIMEHRLSGAEKVLEERRLAASRQVPDPGPEPKLFYQGNEMSFDITQEQLKQYRDNVVAWERYLGVLDEKIRAASSTTIELARRTQLRNEAQKVLNEVNAPAEFPREGELQKTQTELNRLVAAMADIDQQLSFDKVICPTCGNLWSPKAPELAKRRSDTLDTVQDLQRSIIPLMQERNSWGARKTEQAMAEDRIKTLSYLPPLVEVDPNSIRAELEPAKASANSARDWLQAVERHMSAMAFWKRTCSDAEVAKRNRANWDTAVKILRDPEFKAKLMSDPLAKARARLEHTAPDFFDMKIYVDDQLDVHVNGRPWWLLSTAQKLQASVALADAFAYAGGSRILAIDGVDTLVGGFQKKLVMFLRSVKEDYDTILLALALEEERPPAFTLLESLQLADGPSYKPLAHWFWVHQTPDGVTVTFRREL